MVETRNIVHPGFRREAYLKELQNLKGDGCCDEVFEFLGVSWHGYPCIPKRNKPIGKTNETFLGQR
jgi:hypothetical protein